MKPISGLAGPVRPRDRTGENHEKVVVGAMVSMDGVMQAPGSRLGVHRESPIFRTVTGPKNYRSCLVWHGGDADDVEIVDYH
jgi:hypothetical protein